jgi:hypothetical protein
MKIKKLVEEIKTEKWIKASQKKKKKILSLD